jgi:hypothetical protein
MPMLCNESLASGRMRASGYTGPLPVDTGTAHQAGTNAVWSPKLVPGLEGGHVPELNQQGEPMPKVVFHDFRRFASTHLAGVTEAKTYMDRQGIDTPKVAFNADRANADRADICPQRRRGSA